MKLYQVENPAFRGPTVVEGCCGSHAWMGNSAAGTAGIQLSFLFLNSKDKKTAGKESWMKPDL